MKLKTYSLNSNKQRQRNGQQLRRIKRREGKRTPLPIPPDTPQKIKPSPLTSTDDSKGLRESEKEVRYDLAYLQDQLLKEVKSLSPDTGGRFKGVIIETKLWKRFLHCYAKFCGNVAKSCDYCGISRNHFYRAIERYPSLNTLIKLIDERFLDNIEETMKRHSLLPNSVVERFFILKTQRKEKYGDGEEKTPIQLEVKFNNLNLMRANGDSNDKPTGSDNREPVSTVTPAN